MPPSCGGDMIPQGRENRQCARRFCFLPGFVPRDPGKSPPLLLNTGTKAGKRPEKKKKSLDRKDFLDILKKQKFLQGGFSQ
jgi:hypothetical protein